MAPELVWAKVPGWNWWPALVLPAPDNARETRGTRSTKKDEGNERIVLFLVDNTVARVPRELPSFTQHYTRFLTSTYANKKLFQAVEEARSLVYEDAAARELQDEAKEQQLIAYPPPVRDDFKRTGRQLLQWLKAAALDPLGPLNKLSDQANKRVLHTVHDNRLVAEKAKRFVLPPEVAAADGPTAAAITARAGSRQSAAPADTAAEQLPAKRQRKPQQWLQMYGDLPATVITSNAAAGQQATADKAAVATTPASIAGLSAGPKAQVVRSTSVPAPKAGSHLAKLRQQQQLMRQLSSAPRGPQPGKPPVADSSAAPSRGRKRARSIPISECDYAEGSDSDNGDYDLTVCSDSDEEQQQRQRGRGLGMGVARKADDVIMPGHQGQQLHNKTKKRHILDLLNTPKSGAAAPSTAAVAAAAVAAAFRGARSTALETAAVSSGIDQVLGSRKVRQGSQGSGSRVGRKQHRTGQLVSDGDSDVDGYYSEESDTDELSGAQKEQNSRWQLCNQGTATTLHRRNSMQTPAHGCPGGAQDRCYSPQLLRPKAGVGVQGLQGQRCVVQHADLAAAPCTCCCCCCQKRHAQHKVSTQQWELQGAAGANRSNHQQQPTADWLTTNPDLMDVTAAAAALEATTVASAAVELTLPACLQQQASAHMGQDQGAADADPEMSLVDVQALADQGLLSSYEKDGLTSPNSILTAAGAPLCPAAARSTTHISTTGQCSIPSLRPPSPLLGAAPVVAVGAEFLPGLEEDLQHAAVIFGSDSEASLQQQEQQARPQEAERQKQYSPAGQQEAAAAPVEGYISDGASAAAAAAEETHIGSLDLEPTLTADAATAAAGSHPNSPSIVSHAGLHLLPDWGLDVITSGPQDSELQAEIAAAAAASSAAATVPRAVVEIPPVLGYKRSALHRSGSSTCEDVRRLALARACSSNRTPDLHSQLQDCKEQLQASTEIVRQLKQQLEAKDEQVAALNSQTSAQAKQLQQQAGELMALRALLGKQPKSTPIAGSPGAATPAPSAMPTATSPGKEPVPAAEKPAAVEASAAAEAVAASSPGAEAADAGEAATLQPVRRSCRVAAATKAAAKDTVSSAFPPATADSDQQEPAKQYKDAESEAADLRQQLSDAKLMVTALEEQLQDVRRQTSAIAKQQQAEAAQLRGWLQAAEIDAALVRNENELLKKVLPSSVVAKFATTAKKPSGKAAGTGGSRAAQGGPKEEGTQAASKKGAAGGRGVTAMKALLASQQAAEAAASNGPATSSAPGAAGTAAAATVDGTQPSGSNISKAGAAAATATAVTCPKAAVPTSKAVEVFQRQPKLQQMPLQGITLAPTAAANPQTLAAALAAIREAAAAGGHHVNTGTAANSMASAQAKAGTAGLVNSPLASTAAAQAGETTFFSLGQAGSSGAVSSPMLVLQPSGGIPLATVLQLNAALSQLAAANASNKAQAAAGGAPTAAANAAALIQQHMAANAQKSAASGGAKSAATQVLVLNAPAQGTGSRGQAGMSKATAAALAHFAVATSTKGAGAGAGAEAVAPTAATPGQAKTGTKPALDLANV